jgi:hypothetical protein
MREIKASAVLVTTVEWAHSMNTAVVWGVMLRDLADHYCCFEGTFCFHVQDASKVWRGRTEALSIPHSA